MANVFPSPVPPVGSPPVEPREDHQGICALVDSVLAGVGAVYVSTRSVQITIIAALTAIAVTIIILFVRIRQPAPEMAEARRHEKIRETDGDPHT